MISDKVLKAFNDLMIMKWLFTVLVFVVAYFVYKALVKSVFNMAKKVNKSITMPNTLKTIVGVIVFIIALLIVLDIWNKSLTALIASLGVGGIIVGLALQEPLTNFFSGIFLITSGALKEGDTGSISGHSGTVESIKINHTIIDTFDGKRVIIPNRTVWTEVLINYWPLHIRRKEILIGVSYNSDLRKVVDLLQKCMEETPLIERKPPPQVIFDSFGSSSINFKVQFWVKKEYYFKAELELAIKIKEAFDSKGIEIPYPQMDIYIKNAVISKNYTAKV